MKLISKITFLLFVVFATSLSIRAEDEVRNPSPLRKFAGRWESISTSYLPNGQIFSSRISQRGSELMVRGRGLANFHNDETESPDRMAIPPTVGNLALYPSGLARGLANGYVYAEGAYNRCHVTSEGRWRMQNGKLYIKTTATVRPFHTLNRTGFTPFVLTISERIQIVGSRKISFVHRSNGVTQRTVSYRPGMRPAAETIIPDASATGDGIVLVY
ncbi:MAG TPA: hypothetical protein VF585_01530 [Chthoniobacterales bacterium]|jgi:hypothetical protein